MVPFTNAVAQVPRQVMQSLSSELEEIMHAVMHFGIYYFKRTLNDRVDSQEVSVA